MTMKWIKRKATTVIKSKSKIKLLVDRNTDKFQKSQSEHIKRSKNQLKFGFVSPVREQKSINSKNIKKKSSKKVKINKRQTRITIKKRDLVSTPPKDQSKPSIQSRSFSPDVSTRKSSRIADVFEKTQYLESKEFWEQQTADKKGVLLGHTNVHVEDIKMSKDVLRRFLYMLPKQHLALDCAAGVGRCTKHLLADFFSLTDLIEPAGNMIKQAKVNLKDLAQYKKGNRARNFYQMGLQDFVFCHKYDCIWTTWGLNYLNKPDLSRFLQRSRINLSKEPIPPTEEELNAARLKGKKIYKADCKWKTGLLFAKENTDSHTYFVDDQKQYIRTIAENEQIFRETGFEIIYTRSQQYKNINIDKYGIVTMWVLKPVLNF